MLCVTSIVLVCTRHTDGGLGLEKDHVLPFTFQNWCDTCIQCRYYLEGRHRYVEGRFAHLNRNGSCVMLLQKSGSFGTFSRAKTVAPTP